MFLRSSTLPFAVVFPVDREWGSFGRAVTRHFLFLLIPCSPSTNLSIKHLLFLYFLSFLLRCVWHVPEFLSRLVVWQRRLNAVNQLIEHWNSDSLMMGAGNPAHAKMIIINSPASDRFVNKMVDALFPSSAGCSLFTVCVRNWRGFLIGRTLWRGNKYCPAWVGCGR